MKKILILVCLIGSLFANSQFSEPKPSVQNPRKLVYPIYTDDVKTINKTLNTMYNIIKAYPKGTVQIVAVSYSSGDKVLRADYDSVTQSRIKTYMKDFGVEFFACENTIKANKWQYDSFISGVKFVPSGVVNIIERQVSGYILVNPF